MVKGRSPATVAGGEFAGGKLMEVRKVIELL